MRKARAILITAALSALPVTAYSQKNTRSPRYGIRAKSAPNSRGGSAPGQRRASRAKNLQADGRAGEKNALASEMGR